MRMNDRHGNEKREEIIFEYCAPAWLTNRAWRLQVVRSCAGWTFCPRTYNRLPNQSLVFEYAQNGNVEGLQDLFGNREASPFDCDERGISLLFYGAFSCDYATCQLLIEQGADGYESTFFRGFRLTPIDWLLFGCGARLDLSTSPTKTVSYQNSIRLLQEYVFSLNPGLNLCLNLGRYLGSKEGFLLSQQTIDPCYYAKPLKERVKTAIELAYGSNDTETVRASIALGSLPPLTHTIRHDVGDSLLHAVACNIGFAFASIATDYVRYFGPEQLVSRLIGWRVLLMELVAQGSQLHCVSKSRTPFLALITGLMTLPNTQHKPIPLKLWLYDWLEDLQDLGVDLADYGSREIDLERHGFVSWQGMGRELTETPMDSQPEYMWTLKCLDYGPSPTDWKITLDRLSDPAAHLPTNIPGGWVEDDEDDHGEGDEDY